MAELIFAEQTLAFEYFEEMGLYVWQPTDETPIFALAEGQTYTVLWDGTPYSATAKEMSLDGITGIGLGNEGIVGIGEDNGQPFIFAYLSDIGTNGMNACYSTAEGDTHTIAIYKGVMNTGANIVTYDRNGQPVIHTGIETVSFNTDVEGEVATYYLHGGNTAEGVSKEVELNLADGDQTVEADPETLMSEVIIKKPVTLLPENIANGVNIAGVVGALEADGGSSGGDGGGVSVPSSDINFYDYDGTRVAAWTLDELAAATALPDNPFHDGLIAQGWNWSLADLQATNRIMDVGQMYVTDDGKTRLYICFVEDERTTIPLKFSQTVANGVTIDWGDGSVAQSLAGTGKVNTSHTYPNSGDYVISLTPADGCTLGFDNGAVFGSSSSYLSSTYYLGSLLKKVEIGGSVTAIGASAFYGCRNLVSVNIPKSVTSISSFSQGCTKMRCIVIPEGYATEIPEQAFQSADTVEYICIPNGITSIGSYAFAECYALRSITLSDSITSIGSEGTFRNCYNVTRIGLSENVPSLSVWCFLSNSCVSCLTIPSGVTTLNNQSLKQLYNLAELHFKSTTPPKAISSNVFDSLPTDCEIYVPTGRLSAYTSAANYPRASTYTYIEE